MGELMVLSVASDTSGCLQLYTTLLSPFRTTVKLYENLEWNSRSCTQNPKLSRTLRLYQAIDFGYELSSPAVLNVKLNWNEDIKAFVKETIFFSVFMQIIVQLELMVHKKKCIQIILYIFIRKKLLLILCWRFSWSSSVHPLNFRDGTASFHVLSSSQFTSLIFRHCVFWATGSVIKDINK